MAIEPMRVLIPSKEQHGGFEWNRVEVKIEARCPVCGGERGWAKKGFSYDGSRRLSVDTWTNPCGHVDKYSAVRREAAENGLN